MNLDRYSIVAGFQSPSLDRLMRMRAEEERAGIQLVAVAGARAELLMPEVERRTELFVAAGKQMVHTPSASPRCAALQSVARDVTFGWL